MTRLTSIIRDILQFLRPPKRWNLPVILVIGLFCGVGLMTVHISRASSYLSDEPATCVNCHIMAPQYATWQHSSHSRVATCNDCHVPHDNFFRKYAYKAKDGSRHAFMFTFRMEPQVIRMHQPGKNVVQENCVRCHQDLMAPTMAGVEGWSAHGDGRRCWECHREIPHGRVNSLAAAPHAHTPQLQPAIPNWLSGYIDSHALNAPAASTAPEPGLQ